MRSWTQMKSAPFVCRCWKMGRMSGKAIQLSSFACSERKIPVTYMWTSSLYITSLALQWMKTDLRERLSYFLIYVYSNCLPLNGSTFGVWAVFNPKLVLPPKFKASGLRVASQYFLQHLVVRILPKTDCSVSKKNLIMCVQHFWSVMAVYQIKLFHSLKKKGRGGQQLQVKTQGFLGLGCVWLHL